MRDTEFSLGYKCSIKGSRKLNICGSETSGCVSSCLCGCRDK